MRNRTAQCSVIDGCNGNILESSSCALRMCPMNNTCGHWSEWSGCSGTCGMGVQTHNRTCPKSIGCVTGQQIETRSCNSTKCRKAICPKQLNGVDVYNFEDGKNLIHSTNSRWKVISKATPSRTVGPSSDNTFGRGKTVFLLA